MILLLSGHLAVSRDILIGTPLMDVVKHVASNAKKVSVAVEKP